MPRCLYRAIVYCVFDCMSNRPKLFASTCLHSLVYFCNATICAPNCWVGSTPRSPRKAACSRNYNLGVSNFSGLKLDSVALIIRTPAERHPNFLETATWAGRRTWGADEAVPALAWLPWVRSFWMADLPSVAHLLVKPCSFGRIQSKLIYIYIHILNICMFIDVFVCIYVCEESAAANLPRRLRRVAYGPNGFQTKDADGAGSPLMPHRGGGSIIANIVVPYSYSQYSYNII